MTWVFPLALYSVSEAAAPPDTPRFVAFIDSCAQRCQLAIYGAPPSQPPFLTFDVAPRQTPDRPCIRRAARRIRPRIALPCAAPQTFPAAAQDGMVDVLAICPVDNVVIRLTDS